MTAEIQAINSFAMSIVESLCVVSLRMFKTVRLLNRWFILEPSHVFSLWAVKKDLSLAALVARFTEVSYFLSFPVLGWVR